MHQPNADKNLHFELLRILASVRGFGADVSEVLTVCEKHIPGDFESWYREFRQLAEWVETTIDEKLRTNMTMFHCGMLTGESHDVILFLVFSFKQRRKTQEPLLFMSNEFRFSTRVVA